MSELLILKDPGTINAFVFTPCLQATQMQKHIQVNTHTLYKCENQKICLTDPHQSEVAAEAELASGQHLIKHKYYVKLHRKMNLYTLASLLSSATLRDVIDNPIYACQEWIITVDMQPRVLSRD